jgi:hypothetical protein
MSLKGHAMLLKVVSAIWVIGMILDVLVFGFLMGRLEIAVPVGFGVVITMVVMWELLLLIPIECDQPGCHGRVGHKWVSQEQFHWIVRYVCQDCGHETAAPISFTFGGGNSWD